MVSNRKIMISMNEFGEGRWNVDISYIVDERGPLGETLNTKTTQEHHKIDCEPGQAAHNLYFWLAERTKIPGFDDPIEPPKKQTTNEQER